MDIRHLDGDPTNNAAANLAYGTRAENYADSVRHGTAAVGRHGERNLAVKLCAVDVRFIRAWLSLGLSTQLIADAFRVDRKSVRRIRDGQTWGGAPIPPAARRATAKLTERDVRFIRVWRELGFTNAAIGRLFRVAPGYVSAIYNRRHRA